MNFRRTAAKYVRFVNQFGLEDVGEVILPIHLKFPDTEAIKNWQRLVIHGKRMMKIEGSNWIEVELGVHGRLFTNHCSKS